MLPDERADRRAIRHRQVRSGDLELHCAFAGDETAAAAPLVILLHGFPAGWSTWRQLLGDLADAGFLAVAPDLRGAGQSDKPSAVSAYRQPRFVDDVLAIAAAFGRHRFAVVGHDVGGGVAWLAAMLHPELVTHLGILNSVHPVGFARQMRRLSQIRRSWYIFAFQVPFVPEIVAGRHRLALLRAALTADGLPPETVDELLSAVEAPGALSAMINWYRAFVRDAILQRGTARPVSAPSLVVWGDRERYLDAALAVPPPDHGWVVNSRTVHLPEAGHWVHHDAPAQVAELLVAHLRQRAPHRGEG